MPRASTTARTAGMGQEEEMIDYSAGERKVVVRDKEYIVTVHRNSKASWTAGGKYEGELIHANGRTERAALREWIAEAKARRP